jgi:hypothetical protein
MTWFEALTGFHEISPNQVRENITVAGDILTSLVNHKTFTCGHLETPSLKELHNRVESNRHVAGKLSVREVIGNVQDLHADPANAGCLFQVASQFNLLEMVSPDAAPEDGVGIYEHDPTQGPACAIAAGAGTIYRNYFADVNGRTGQAADNQIDCLADIGEALGNSDQRLWVMKNGYALPSHEGLVEISGRLAVLFENELDQLRQLLRIGVQWNTQVTIRNSRHTVTQTYCSALPVAYSDHPADLWEAFARLVLEASYEATLCAAILNSLTTGNHRVFLTLLGGGAFGNKTGWIIDAIRRALKLYSDWNLEIAIVSYGSSNPHVRQLAEEFSS